MIWEHQNKEGEKEGCNTSALKKYFHADISSNYCAKNAGWWTLDNILILMRISLVDLIPASCVLHHESCILYSTGEAKTPHLIILLFSAGCSIPGRIKGFVFHLSQGTDRAKIKDGVF